MPTIGSQMSLEWASITPSMMDLSERELQLSSIRSSTTNTKTTATPTNLSNTASPIFTPVSTGANTPHLPSPGRPSLIGSQSFSNPGGIPVTTSTSVPESGSKQKFLKESYKPSASESAAGVLKSPRVFGWATPLLSPIGSPLRRRFETMKVYLQEIGHLTTIDPHDAWLPITESRGGNAYYAAFHNLNAIIGFQALILPVAFTFLGWTWGIMALTFAFGWFVYTKWLLVEMHECVPGRRISRYLDLAETAFGERWGFYLVAPMVINLAAGTCIGLITIGATSLELFFRTVCPTCTNPLTPIEWYLVFTLFCVLLAHFPNLNSVAGVSLVGAIMAMAYCTLVWSLSISVPRPASVKYEIVVGKSTTASVFMILNALGLIAFAFRGHNLSLEIQATMPSTLKHPSRVPMWNGALWAFAGTAFCFFPLSIGGYWAYGDKMMGSGILFSILAFHEKQIAPALLGITFIFVVLQSLCSFQIYAMPLLDLIEQFYTKRKDRKMNSYLRFLCRTFFVFTVFLVAIAIPFLSSLAGLAGGLSIPMAFLLPSLLYLKLKRPERGSLHWYLNWALSILGAILTVTVSAGGVWSVVETGVKVQFFKPA
ncbi:unnamed protein product [Calypogeia fissa]